METLLGKLRRAVQKVKFVLMLSVNKWKVASMLGRSSRLSFSDRPGLRVCMADSGSDERPESSGGLRRTASYPPEDDDDVDKRADAFIANFHKQLRFERQISLQLRYCTHNSSP
ncbi:uncharacterized protein LOC130990029 [Salvia miltiorrhiza]|uniref:uncharacterized protein LOC130990029 n=1 Tax=Salvia miltiorrhiza TaxID=226208 RepID=UPI0025ACEA28|nr:uncharacterized protein LOC130990029 [Salvia miltiorrhiza]